MPNSKFGIGITLSSKENEFEYIKIGYWESPVFGISRESVSRNLCMSGI